MIRARVTLERSDGLRPRVLAWGWSRRIRREALWRPPCPICIAVTSPGTMLSVALSGLTSPRAGNILGTEIPREEEAPVFSTTYAMIAELRLISARLRPPPAGSLAPNEPAIVR